MLIEIMSSAQIIRSKQLRWFTCPSLAVSVHFIINLIIPIRLSFQPFSLAVFALKNLEMSLKVSVVLEN